MSANWRSGKTYFSRFRLALPARTHYLGYMRRLIGTLTALIVLAGLPAAAAAAAETTHQKLDYNIYTGGLKTLSADLEIVENNPQDYRLLMNARTDGLLKIFKKWNGTMKTQGRLSDDGTAWPSVHESVSVWPDNTQIKKFEWAGNGELEDLYISEEGRTTDLADIESGLADDSVDIMTAALAIMRTAADTGTCGGQTEVFDGKRRFLMSGIDRGVETLAPSRLNKFGGEALRCEIKIVPQEGDWHEKLKGWMSIQEQGKEAGAAPIVWLARLEEGGPAVPVKIRAKTSYGTFLMHLAAVHEPSASSIDR